MKHKLSVLGHMKLKYAFRYCMLQFWKTSLITSKIELFLDIFDPSVTFGWKWCVIYEFIAISATILEYLWFLVFGIIIHSENCSMEFWDIAVCDRIPNCPTSELWTHFTCSVSLLINTLFRDKWWFVHTLAIDFD